MVPEADGYFSLFENSLMRPVVEPVLLTCRETLFDLLRKTFSGLLLSFVLIAGINIELDFFCIIDVSCV